MAEQQDLPAGGFSSWLRRTRSTLVKENGVAVPCGGCNACCRSSYFIHIRPEETQTLARIPEKLLFAAPGLPQGHVLLGRYANGHCPMLQADKCSIYEHRPLTCRNYDCRIFPAAGITAGEKAMRLRRWKFSYPTRRDHSRQAAVKAAAIFLREQADCFPAGVVPSNPTPLAILALKVYGVFLMRHHKPGKNGHVTPASKIAEAIMRANEKFYPRRNHL